MTDQTTTQQWPDTVEIWLRQDTNGMGVTCTVVRPDESTQELDVHSLSLRGAEREITGWLIAAGLDPYGRWVTQHTAADLDGVFPVEVMRTFKRRLAVKS